MVLWPASKEERFEKELQPLLGLMYRYGLRLTKNPEMAQDLVQDASVKAFERWDQLKDKERFRPWLLRIIFTTFVDQRRKFSRQPETASLDERYIPKGQEEKEGPREATTNPEEEMLRRELGSKIKEALDELPEQYRLPVFLAYGEGLSYEEVAAALDCPLGTVMSRLHRGRRILREKLEEYASLLAY